MLLSMSFENTKAILQIIDNNLNINNLRKWANNDQFSINMPWVRLVIILNNN